MQNKTCLISLSLLATTIFGQTYADDSAPKTTTQNGNMSIATDSNDVDMKKLSEALGHFIGRNLNMPGVKFDLDSIIQGMREGAAGKPAPMSDQEYEMMMAHVQEKAFKQMSKDNLAAAVEFLRNNTKDSKVKEIEPGKLQFIILEEGNGPAVTEHSSPLINYTGKYLDGKVFGSSQEAGGAITVPLDQTIPGFSKGMVGMKEGEKRRIFVHPDLGYGTTGGLSPNSLLIFEVEVVKANNEDNKQASADSIDEDNDDDEEDGEGYEPIAMTDDDLRDFEHDDDEQLHGDDDQNPEESEG